MSVSEIITDGGRRRHWGATEKLRIVEETLDGRDSISVVARRNGVAPNLLYRWRRQAWTAHQVFDETRPPALPDQLPALV